MNTPEKREKEKKKEKKKKMMMNIKEGKKDLSPFNFHPTYYSMQDRYIDLRSVLSYGRYQIYIVILINSLDFVITIPI